MMCESPILVGLSAGIAAFIIVGVAGLLALMRSSTWADDDTR